MADLGTGSFSGVFSCAALAMARSRSFRRALPGSMPLEAGTGGPSGRGKALVALAEEAMIAGSESGLMAWRRELWGREVCYVQVFGFGKLAIRGFKMLALWCVGWFLLNVQVSLREECGRSCR